MLKGFPFLNIFLCKLLPLIDVFHIINTIVLRNSIYKYTNQKLCIYLKIHYFDILSCNVDWEKDR